MRKLLASIAVLCLLGWNFPVFAGGGGSGGGGGFGGGGSHGSSGGHGGGGPGNHATCSNDCPSGDGGVGSNFGYYPGASSYRGRDSYDGPRIVPSGTGKIWSYGEGAELFTVALHRELQPAEIGNLKREGWDPQPYGGGTYYCNLDTNTCFRVDSGH